MVIILACKALKPVHSRIRTTREGLSLVDIFTKIELGEWRRRLASVGLFP